MLRLRDEQWSELDKMLPENLRKLPEDWGKIDQLLEELLEDEQILGLFYKKHPSQMGRPTYPIEKYLRLMYVKSHYDLGYESLVKEVGDSFTLRRFCRISIDEPMPNSTTLLKIGQRYGEKLTEELNQRLVKKLADQRIIKHRKMRTDTTVTESNIHHPTDATLLQDGVRVITRMMSKVRKVASHAAEGFEDMTNEVKKNILSLVKVLHRRTRETSEAVRKIHHQVGNETESVCRQTETVVEENKEAKVSQRPTTKRLEEIKQVNRQIVEITESVCCKAKIVVEKLKEKGVKALQQGKEKLKEALDQIEEKLTEAIGRTEILIRQTKQVISGNIIIPKRMVSFFDPEARPIKKGKLSKKTEFGFKTRIDETESGFVTGYDVYEGNPSDEELLLPAVENHQTLFGEVPHAVATDRGFSSKQNEELLANKGVRHVSMPKRGKKSKKREEQEQNPCFKNLQRFRAGGEAKISLLKRKYGLGRSRYIKLAGVKVWVGMGILAHNLYRAAKMIL